MYDEKTVQRWIEPTGDFTVLKKNFGKEKVKKR
jgi:hypothetical protein